RPTGPAGGGGGAVPRSPGAARRDRTVTTGWPGGVAKPAGRMTEADAWAKGTEVVDTGPAAAEQITIVIGFVIDSETVTFKSPHHR
ncbi:MAG TPA: hypothetical protein PKN61_13345, partial [Acidobacteriota bacterium]|nr:hypothetical protein [Acidobacteriota bacterium]HQO26301.1 hypothetical protein [Acidobacteriota bacterium]